MPLENTPVTNTRIARVRAHSKRSGFPPVPKSVPAELVNYLEILKSHIELRDAQRGSPLDASPTFKDLIDSGVVSLSGLTVAGREFTVDQIRSLLASTTPDWVTSELAPPPPTNVVVTLRETSVQIAWDDIALSFTNFSHTEIWRASANNLATAVQLYWNDAASIVDALPPANTQYFYWVRHVSRAGIIGGFHGISGASWAGGTPATVSTGTIATVDGDILINWAEPASNIDIKYYVIYALDTENDPILPALGRSNTSYFYYTPPAGGTYRFGILAIPLAGQEPVAPTAAQMSPFTIALSAFSAPTGLSYQIIGNKIELSWGNPSNLNAGTSLRLAAYEIWHTAVGTTLVQSVGGLTNRFRVPIDYSGSTRTYYVVAVDSAGVRGAAASIAIQVTLVSAPTGFAATINGEDIELTWNTPTSLMPLAEYEVQYGDVGFSWGAGTSLPRISGNSLFIRPTWNGTKEFEVRAYDINGNAGEIASISHTITPHAAPSGFRTDVVDNNVLLYWTPAVQSASQLPVIAFEVRRGNSASTWATATPIGTKQGTFTTIFEASAGTYRYHIAAVDSADQYGASVSVLATVAQPPDYILNANLDEPIAGIIWDFEENTVEGWSGSATVVTAADSVLKLAAATTNDPQLLRSVAANTPLIDMTPYGRQFFFGCEWPVIQVRLRRTAGAGTQNTLYYSRTAALDGTGTRSWDGSFYKTGDVSLPAAADGWKIITYDMSSLTVGSTDWMVSRIHGLRFDFGAAIGDAFEIDWIRALPFKVSNMGWDDLSGVLAGPFDFSRTFQQHFDDNAWATGDAKIAAGYDHFLQPSAAAGWIEKTIDYGTELPGMKLSSLPTFTALDGTVIAEATISLSNTSAVAGFTDNVGQDTVFGVGFRWAKIRWDFTTADGNDTINVAAFNTKTDAKIRNDMGMGSAVAGDAGGTTVTFNVDFVDVQAINVTPSGTAARYAIYDFVDEPNPTTFKVLLFDTAGTRVSGGFSWAARGY